MFSNIVGDAIIKCMSMKKTFEKSKNEANNESKSPAVYSVKRSSHIIPEVDVSVIQFKNI